MTTVPVRPPLVRSSDRMIAGVCAGLAAHLGWPVRMVRIGMAVAALAGGAGFVFYAMALDHGSHRRRERQAQCPAAGVADCPRGEHCPRGGHAAQPAAAVDPPLWAVHDSVRLPPARFNSSQAPSRR